MGERAQRLGREFQNSMLPILDSLGYTLIKSNFDVPCKDRNHRNDQNNPRRSHGIDLLIISRTKNEENLEIIYVSPKRGSSKPINQIIDEHYNATRCLNEYIEEGGIPNVTGEINTVWIISENLLEPSNGTKVRRPETPIKIHITTSEELRWLVRIGIRLQELSRKGNYHFFQPYYQGFSTAFTEFGYPEWISSRLYVYLPIQRPNQEHDVYLLVFQNGKVSCIDIDEILNSTIPIYAKELIIHCSSGFNEGERLCVRRINQELSNNQRPGQNVRKLIIVSERQHGVSQYPEESEIWEFNPL